jgi:hypothetical protein
MLFPATKGTALPVMTTLKNVGPLDWLCLTAAVALANLLNVEVQLDFVVSPG